MSIFEHDRALLERFRAGEHRALGAVYDRYVDDVSLIVARGFVLEDRSRVSGVGDRETQRDLVHDVFVRAFAERARAAYDGLRPYRPYLLRIAKNILIDRARRSGRELPLDGRAASGAGVVDLDALIRDNAALQPEPPRPADEELDWRRTRAVTLEYVAGLSEELRHFVKLRFEEEQSQHDVARLMGITRRRVRTLQAQVLDGLVELLERPARKPT